MYAPRIRAHAVFSLNGPLLIVPLYQQRASLPRASQQSTKNNTGFPVLSLYIELRSGPGCPGPE